MKKLWLNPKISFKTFCKLNDKLYPKMDIKPMHADRMIFELLRDRQLNIYITSGDDSMNFTLKEIPKKSKIITNKINTKIKCQKQLKRH